MGLSPCAGGVNRVVHSAIFLRQPAIRKRKINAGLPPHKTNTGFCGDPGVELCKSIFFGVDGGGGVGIAVIAVIAT